MGPLPAYVPRPHHQLHAQVNIPIIRQVMFGGWLLLIKESASNQIDICMLVIVLKDVSYRHTFKVWVDTGL